MSMGKNRLGVLVFIASEATFFIFLIIAYVYFQSIPSDGPTAASSLNPITTGVFSLFLFASSFTVWQAERSFTASRRGRFSAWMAATIILGGVFLAGQLAEWSRLITAGATIRRNLFGTAFFTLTRFHGAHVLIGLAVLLILAGLGWKGAIGERNSDGVKAVSLYWHFVDLVWVVLYAVIYLQLLAAKLA